MFFGTPAVAVPFFEFLTEHSTVVGVVCRPDEPAGRGQKITAPPVKVAALQKNIPVFQPSGPWTEERVNELKQTQPDIGIVVAYGRIMPRSVFSIPKLGCVNIHFSLLPKYRGAAPMQWALINGETKTGVTAFELEEGMDSGPIIHQLEIPIAPADDARSLREKLVPLGLKVLGNVLNQAAKGALSKTPQSGSVVMAPLLKKETGEIKWSAPSEKIRNLIRGVCEWPGATTRYRTVTGETRPLKILKADLFAPRMGECKIRVMEPGAVLEAVKDRGMLVQTGDGRLLVQDVQPEGKKGMPAWAFWQGAHLNVGDKLG